MVEHTSATTRGRFRSQPERCNNAKLRRRRMVVWPRFLFALDVHERLSYHAADIEHRLLFFTLNREDFSFVIHLDWQPRTSRRREAQTGSRARSGSRSERTLDAVEHSRTLMEWWPFLIFHRGGLRIKVINNNRGVQRSLAPHHHLDNLIRPPLLLLRRPQHPSCTLSLLRICFHRVAPFFLVASFTTDDLEGSHSPISTRFRISSKKRRS